MLLTDASAIKVGTADASAVYVGSTKVWPEDTGGGGLSDLILSYNPIHYWPMDEASGNLADAAGSSDLAVFGTLVYGKQLTGFVGVKAEPGSAYVNIALPVTGVTLLTSTAS